MAFPPQLVDGVDCNDCVLSVEPASPTSLEETQSSCLHVAEFSLLTFCEGFLHLCHESYCFVVSLFCFWCCLCLGLISGWHKLCKVCLEVFPPHLIFWKPLWKNDVHSSLNVWCNSALTPTGPGYLFIGSFKIMNSISFIVSGIFKLSVAQGRFVVVCVFSIHLVLSCQIYVYGVVPNGLLLSFGCLQGL